MKWMTTVAFVALVTAGCGAEPLAEDRCCEGPDDTACLPCGCFDNGDCGPNEICDQDTTESFVTGGVCAPDDCENFGNCGAGGEGGEGGEGGTSGMGGAGGEGGTSSTSQ